MDGSARVFALLLLTGCSSPVGSADGSTDADTVAADASTAASTDGTPMRTPCTKQLANKLGASFGRLDGYLRAVIAPGGSGCFADADHVHLQVSTADGSYDIAVNVKDTGGPAVQLDTLDVALPDGPWSEGWHDSATLDYVKLGVRSTDFTPLPAAQLAQRLASELASANHLSVFAVPYSDGTGGHEVHRNHGGDDGALVVRPTDGTAHLLLFHFASQSF